MRINKTYYWLFKQWLIKPKDIDEEKIFWIRNFKYIKTMNNKLKYNLFNNN